MKSKIKNGEELFNSNVMDFGAVANGETLCTKAVQKTVDVCHKNGGGIVEFAVGKYVIGTIFLKSNVHIRLIGRKTCCGLIRRCILEMKNCFRLRKNFLL